MLHGITSDLFVEAGVLTSICSLAPLTASMIIGLLIGALQAATQIQEQSLGFIAKIVALAGVLLVGGTAMADALQQFMVESLMRVEQFAW